MKIFPVDCSSKGLQEIWSIKKDRGGVFIQKFTGIKVTESSI
jgi:hypothetical protein